MADTTQQPQSERAAAILKALGQMFPGPGRQQAPSSPGLPAVEGTAVNPAAPPQLSLMQPSAQGPSVKMDPRASVAPLPMPNARPPQQALYNRSSGDDIFQSSLNPKNQAIFNAIQGTQQFIGNFMEKRDKEKHAEASNAAQSLMQALNAGDYTAANDILHQNEGLFNKVYKGWLQKATKSQEASNKAGKEKVQTDVAGVQKGIEDYLSGQSGQGQPQPPKPPQTIGQSKQAPGGYYLPKATPDQMLQQQKGSSELQATQQDPARMLDSPVTSGEMRAGMLSKLGFLVTPEDQLKLSEAWTQYQGQQKQLEAAGLEVQKAQIGLQQSQLTGDVKLETAQAALQTAQERTLAMSFEADRYRTMYDITTQKLIYGQTGKIPQTVMQKWGAIQQVQSILKDKKDLTSQDVQSLQVQLKNAGMESTAKNLSGIMNRLAGSRDPSSLRDAVSHQADALQSEFPGLAIQSKQANSGGVITVSPEDMK